MAAPRATRGHRVDLLPTDLGQRDRPSSIAGQSRAAATKVDVHQCPKTNPGDRAQAVTRRPVAGRTDRSRCVRCPDRCRDRETSRLCACRPAGCRDRRGCRAVPAPRMRLRAGRARGEMRCRSARVPPPGTELSRLCRLATGYPLPPARDSREREVSDLAHLVGPSESAAHSRRRVIRRDATRWYVRLRGVWQPSGLGGVVQAVGRPEGANARAAPPVPSAGSG